MGDHPGPLTRLEPGAEPKGVVEVAVGVDDRVKRGPGPLPDLLVDPGAGALHARVDQKQTLRSLEGRQIDVVRGHEEGVRRNELGLVATGEVPLEQRPPHRRVDVPGVVDDLVAHRSIPSHFQSPLTFNPPGFHGGRLGVDVLLVS